jgi:hypothetical protein
MKQKPIVEKKIQGIKIGLVYLENMMSRQATREEFLEQLERVKGICTELEVLINREDEVFE